MKKRAGICFLVLASAVGGQAAPTNVLRGCIDTFDPAADYFPDKARVEDAADFSVEYRKSYKVVTVRDANPGGPPERYVLLQCGAPRPALQGDLAGAPIVQVPASALFVYSTTHLAMLVDLERVDAIAGVSQLDLFEHPSLSARIRAGRVVEFANGLLIDAERVVASRPSVLMAGETASATLSSIRSAGVPIVGNADWREPTALARAEWLKYVALFLNEERKAETAYGGMKARYRALAARTAAVPAASRPLVMTGRSSRGMFLAAGGQSYVAALIKDAGGRYVFADNTATGSFQVDLETMISRAANADIWINGGGWASRAAMLQDESRYTAFKAYRQGQVWVYERRVLASGGNDYWSRGSSHPDLLLEDLVKVFHPSLVPSHAFEWYLQVPAR